MLNTKTEDAAIIYLFIFFYSDWCDFLLYLVGVIKAVIHKPGD